MKLICLLCFPLLIACSLSESTPIKSGSDRTGWNLPELTSVDLDGHSFDQGPFAGDVAGKHLQNIIVKSQIKRIIILKNETTMDSRSHLMGGFSIFDTNPIILPVMEWSKSTEGLSRSVYFNKEWSHPFFEAIFEMNDNTLIVVTKSAVGIRIRTSHGGGLLKYPKNK